MNGTTETSPIFVTGFSRGGTTILMNLLASHRDACTIGEVHQVFKGSSVLDSKLTILKKSVMRDLPMMMRTGQDFFSPRLWAPREPVSVKVQQRIQQTLTHAKNHSAHDHLNRYKSPTETYTSDEIRDARMLGKNLDGTVFLYDTLKSIYPDASFCGMVRHGLAVCEGHVRRGRKAKNVGIMYRRVVQKMLDDAACDPRYQFCRFEDLLTNPVTELTSMLQHLGLDSNLSQVRLQRRRVMNEAGEHLLTGQREWEVYWLNLNELPQYLDGDVNRRQILQLSDRDRDAFLSEAEDTMERLGYCLDGSLKSMDLIAA